MMRVLSIAWKDIRVRFSSRSEILFFLILPVFFIFILGGGFSGVSETVPGVRLPVVDEDESDRSAELLAALEDTDAVRIEVLARAEAEAIFEEQSAPALLIIPAGFEDRLAGGQPAELELRKAPSDLDALAVEQAVGAAAAKVGRALGVANASVAEAERLGALTSPAAQEAYFEASLAQARDLVDAAPARMLVSQPMLPEEEANTGYDQTAQGSAGQLITWVFIPLLATSGLFAAERSLGTLQRLITTPTRSPTYLLGTITGQLLTAFVQMALLLGFAVGVLDLNLGHSPAGLVVSLMAFALAAVALGTLLGTFTKTESQANGLSILLGMAMALLGGCWYPIELFPEAARVAAKILPTNWAMQALTDLMMRGQGLAEILPEAGVLLGFAVVFFVVGIWRFRYE